MVRFQIFLNQGELGSLNATGMPYTWTNNHKDDILMFERLDRAVANHQWFNKFSKFSLQNLLIVGSDHGLIWLSFHSKSSNFFNMFKLAMWLRHPGISDIVQKAWNNHVVGSPVQKFVTLCNSFKCLAKSWNKNVFGDLF